MGPVPVLIDIEMSIDIEIYKVLMISTSVVDPRGFQCESLFGSNFLSQGGFGSVEPNQCGYISVPVENQVYLFI